MMLTRYQDRMIAIADEAQPLLAARCETNLAKLASLRLSMAQTLTSYQLHFHREIYECALADPRIDERTRAALREIKSECIMLAEDFRAHTRRWAIESGLDAWETYAGNSIALGLRIRRHIAAVRGAMQRLPIAAPTDRPSQPA